MQRKAVAVDLDGVLARYDGWKGVNEIGDPIPGAKEFVTKLVDTYRVIVFTTRTNASANPGYRKSDLVTAVEEWLNRNGFPGYPDVVVHDGGGKPMAVAYVDDRGVSCRPQGEQEPRQAFKAAFLEVDRLAGKILSGEESEKEKSQQATGRRTGGMRKKRRSS